MNEKETITNLVNNRAVRMVNMDDLQIDSSYQRVVKEAHRKIILNYCEESFGIIVVAQREDGSLWIVDGLQRYTAAKKMKWSKIKAEVFASSGPEHEALVFKYINLGRTKLTPGEQFRSLLASQNEQAWEIKKCVEKCGFKIALSNKSGSYYHNEDGSKLVSGVLSLLKMHKEWGVDSITFALEVVKECFPGDKDGVNIYLIQGLGYFYHQKEKIVDTGRLIPRMKTVSPHKILYAAMQTVLGGSKYTAVANQIEIIYQKKLRNSK